MINKSAHVATFERKLQFGKEVWTPKDPVNASDLEMSVFTTARDRDAFASILSPPVSSLLKGTSHKKNQLNSTPTKS